MEKSVDVTRALGIAKPYEVGLCIILLINTSLVFLLKCEQKYLTTPNYLKQYKVKIVYNCLTAHKNVLCKSSIPLFR